VLLTLHTQPFELHRPLLVLYNRVDNKQLVSQECRYLFPFVTTSTTAAICQSSPGHVIHHISSYRFDATANNTIGLV